MAFKHLQFCYILSVLLFLLVFWAAKEIANYTTEKETNNRYIRLVCFAKEPVPLATFVLIAIDYAFLALMLACNIVSLFLPESGVLHLFLIGNGAFLAFCGIAGGICNRVKKKYYGEN